MTVDTYGNPSEVDDVRRQRDHASPARRGARRRSRQVQVVAAGLALVAWAVATAVAAPVAGAAPGPLANPSLEADSDRDGVPDCFDRGGYGRSTAAFSRVFGGHGGTYAERVRVTAYADGDRKLVPAMRPGCAPTVTAGESDTVSVWYRSTVPVELVLYTSGPAGWAYWLDGPTEPSSSTWRQAAMSLPAIPAGVTAVSFGLAIHAVGEVVTDDYAITATPCPSGYVALTFDDGPGPRTTDLLDTLAAERARATFFVVGDQIDPDRGSVVEREAREGHVVGNHTATHPHLPQLDDGAVRDELSRVDDRLVALGVPRPKVFRPPYSETDARIDGIAGSLGLTTTLWSVDAGDTDDGATADRTVSRAVSGATAGSIIVMHDLVPDTVAAAPRIIDGLRARGFCFGVVRPSALYSEQNRSYVEVAP